MKDIKKLSIIIPVYNERSTIEKIIKRVMTVDLGKVKKEIIVIDDGSNDGTEDVLRKMKKVGSATKIIYLKHHKNRGKSRALRSGFTRATGEVVVIQDGDMEYDPNDFKKMLRKMEGEGVQVVYGSRRIEPANKQYSGLGFYAGGLLLTYLANFLFGCRITDEPTCYKMIDRKLLNSLNIRARKFDFCPEVTAKIANRGIQIYEVPISYHPRHIDQGKKIKLKDFFQAVWMLIKIKITKL
jgi:dolichol-phosphate mannosyltransferase